jgi:serine/threonine-protein kinase
MLSDKGDLAGAERALRESLAIRMETVGPHHRDTLIVEHNLLVTLEMEGRIAESLPQRMALIERAANSEQMHPRDLASYYNAAGRDLRELGRLDESEAMFGRALAAYAEALGPHSPQSVSALRGLAATSALKGRYGDAEKTLRDALDIVRRHGDETSLGVANVRTDLGRVLRLEHRVPEALTELEAASDAMDRKHAADVGRPLTTAELAQAKLDAGDADAALAIAERAVAQGRTVLPERHFLLAEPLFALARAQFALGHYAEADPLLREALSVRKALEPADDPRVLELEVALAATDERLGRSVDARSLRHEVDARLASLDATYAADLRRRFATSAPVPAPAAARR